MAGFVGPAAFTAAGGGAAGAGGFIAGAAGGAAGAFASQSVLTVGNHIAFGDPMMTAKQFIVGVAFGAALGGTINGISAVKNGNTFWKGIDPTPKVSPISLPQAADLSKTANAEIRTDAKLPSTTQTNTAPTTQANTTGKVTFTKNIDGNGYKVEGLGIVDDGGGQISKAEIGYHPRVEEATDLYHNFPRSFDEHIIQNGSWSQRIKDGANWFELKGTINGVKGTYQIGINKSNIIFHKNFIPLK